MKYSFLIIILLFWTISTLHALKTESNSISNELIKKHFQKGMTHYNKKEYQLAIKEWDYLIQNKKLNKKTKALIYDTYKKIYEAKKYYIKGMNSFKSNQLKTAQTYFQQATNIYPYHREALLMFPVLEKQIAINQYLAEARKKIKNKKYQKALSICKTVLEIESGNIKALKLIEQCNLLIQNEKIQDQIDQLVLQGITYFSNKQYSRSRTTFNTVLKMDPDNFAAIQYLDLINKIYADLKEQEMLQEEAEKYYQTGIAFYKKAEYNNALQGFQNALALIANYKNSEDYIEKINNKLKQMELARLRENERLISEYLNQGITYYYNSEYKMAISMLEKCLLLDPENEYEQDYLKKAKEALVYKEEEFITEDSPYYEFVLKLRRKALYYYDSAQYSESLNWWGKILKLFPSNKEAREMAIVITMKLDKDQAEQFLAIHFERGKNHFNNKEYRFALKEFQMIQKIDPQYKGITDYINKTMKYLEKPPVVKLPVRLLKQYYDKGLKYYKQKQYDLAIAEWQKILKDNSSENPYRVNAIVNINKVKRKITFNASEPRQEKSGADNKFSEIAKKHYLKGVAFYMKGKYEKAIREWKIVLKYDPNHINAKNNIEKCRRKLQFSE